MYTFFPESGKCSTLDFYFFFFGLFLKVSFCFQYFHINLLEFEFGHESEKGADSGFTIGSRERIYN